MLPWRLGSQPVGRWDSCLMRDLGTHLLHDCPSQGECVGPTVAAHIVEQPAIAIAGAHARDKAAARIPRAPQCPACHTVSPGVRSTT